MQATDTQSESSRAIGAASTATLTPPAYGEYWPGQGGFYGGIAPPMHGLPARHLVFSDAEGVDLEWGGYDKLVDGAGSHYDGRTNTRALLDSKEDHPAALWAAAFTADGHKDFHLPSRLELMLAFCCASHRFEKSDCYWSSTQGSRSHAWVQDFEDGTSINIDKDYECRVRAVRWIPLQSSTPSALEVVEVAA